MPLRIVLASVIAASFFAAAGCNDTAIVLRIASDRPLSGGSALDGICIELDAGGGKRFGRRYDLPSLPLPQTLTVLPGGRSSAQLIVYGTRRGTEVARVRRDLSFRSGSVLHVDVPLDACQPHASSGLFAAIAAPTAEAVDAVALVPGAHAFTSGDLALALAAGQSTRVSVGAAGVGALVGGAPDAPAGRVRQLVVGDFDGDCRRDVVIVADGAPLAVWRDAGDGTFTLMTMVGVPGMLSAAAGDVDGDGAVDLVAVGGGAAHVWLNDGAGHFREGSAGLDVAPTDATVVALADLDGDGNLDLILGQGSAAAAVARVYLNDKGGTGHFTYTPAALPPKPARASAIAVGDIDNDGDLDVVLAQSAGPVRVYVNRGDAFLDDRSFTLLPDQVSGNVPNLLLADLDGDCLPELVVPRAGAAPLLWRSAGGGALGAGGGFDQALAATGASADDVDGDGDLDVLLWGGATGLQLEVQQ
ncbi:MAG: FG-GAP repeat domain-containing protein [Polyangia bacterium]